MNISLILSVIIILLIAAIFIHKIRGPRDEGSHWPINLAGFPTVHVHKETASHAEAETLANALRMTYREAWAVFAAFYEQDPRNPAPIARIGLNTGEEISRKHLHIRWVLPDNVDIRFQPSMYYHFTGELHNMFRVDIHGFGGGDVVPPAQDDLDRERRAKVQQWIDSKYGR